MQKNFPQDLDSPEYFISRELSWMEFNQRVLEEALDATQPLLERVRFSCIVSSNLDEFFEVRVAGIKQQIENGTDENPLDGMTPGQLFEAIQKRAHKMVGDQCALWNKELVPALKKAGIVLHDVSDLPPDKAAWAEKHFREEVMPVLTPLAVDSSHPFPQLLNKSHNLIISLHRAQNPAATSYGIVQIPRVLSRLVALPGNSKENGWHFIILERLIRHFVADLFQGDSVIEVDAFRLTRNSDLYIDDEEAENLLHTIEEELRKRNRGNAVRLEVQAGCSATVERFLMDTYRLEEADVYHLSGPLNFLHLLPLCSHEAFPHLRDRPWSPFISREVPVEADLFAIIRQKDILLHHPYESFNTVVDFVERAAQDRQVLAIKMTLYRTSGDSPIVRALIHAAENGKQVTALVELKARFDEANNINWARQLEEAGVHVVYGMVGLKTHCKILLIVRRDEDRIRLYSHFGTGNYHPSTARFYTDLSLFTTNPQLTGEMATLFNILTGLCRFDKIEQLLVAPFSLAKRFLALIEREAELARAGKAGRIIAKMNSLVDIEIIKSLYRASQAGVKIDLIVRGMCCLRPGLPGVSENIRVVSIVGRFLEHSRIFYFGNEGDPQVYLGSADWMSRNLHRRIEVVFPILDPAIKKRITDEIIPAFMQDCVKARELQSDASHQRLRPAPGRKPFQAQLTFRELARRRHQAEPAQSGDEIILIPITRPPASR